MARTKKGPLQQRAEYLLYRGIARAATALSEPAAARWGTRLGNVARMVLRRRDALAMSNLRAAFPEKSAEEVRATADACWRHFGREALAYVRLRSLPLEEIAARCPFVNEQLLRDGLARGNGVVLISAHYGGWEIAGLALLAHVDKVRTVARPLDNAYLDQELMQMREKTGADVVDRKGAARALMKTLAENGVVVLLPDQAVLPREGILTSFMGRPCWTTPVPAKLAVRAGATIVFAFCIPHENGHRLELETAILAGELDSNDSDPANLTQRINDVISRRIAERPELWLWMHDRWKGTGETTAHDARA